MIYHRFFFFFFSPSMGSACACHLVETSIVSHPLACSFFLVTEIWTGASFASLGAWESGCRDTAARAKYNPHGPHHARAVDQRNTIARSSCDRIDLHREVNCSHHPSANPNTWIRSCFVPGPCDGKCIQQSHCSVRFDRRAYHSSVVRAREGILPIIQLTFLNVRPRLQ
ncbi:hypothetical protein BJX64DRAFT_220120 [Aspergillus heterothallicus]